MGFLDKAKRKLQEATRGFGEETVQKTERDPEPSQRSDPPHEEHDSDFAVDDNYGKKFFEKKEQEHQELLKSYGDTPVPKVVEGRIQDVLELLNIPATFEIDDTVLLPEDLKDVSFDIQVPQGYEIGEVNAFVARVRHTVGVLVDLLKQRNKHIAELATTVDRSQVDANNLKVQAEIANGINVMPTDGNEALENENMELRLLVKRLEDQMKSLKQGVPGTEGSLSDKERQEYESMSDQVSLLSKDKERLESENQSLKDQLAVYLDEDDNALDQTDEARRDLYHRAISDETVPDEQSAFALPEAEEGHPSSIPDLDDDDDDESLPSFGDDDFSPFTRKSSAPHIPEVPQSSVFSGDDEPLDQFLEENKEYYEGHDYTADQSTVRLADDDDDDELDRIFNNRDKDNG